MSARESVYTIPAGLPFAKTLAAQLFDTYKENQEKLADIIILLPTRRACRIMRDAFLTVSEGSPLILPSLQAIGDIDEEELSIAFAGQGAMQDLLNLPPGINPLKRQILLARLIHSADSFTQGFHHALFLAKALAHFLDQIYTEDLELTALKDLVPEEFADHWQITLKFLEILSLQWPEILKEQGVIDIADRRNRLILALGEYWTKNQPQKRIIAAGTTGSIPAVAQLLSVIAALPNGQIILPGFDAHIDKDSWEALKETHPQFGFKQLLTRMGLKHEDVQQWPQCPEQEISRARRTLAHELMRPAETTNSWTDLAQSKTMQITLRESLKNLNWFECEDEREEAKTIATLMRETLETPKRTAALITPNRDLARRVAMTCRRWGITLDDSGGQSLNQTQAGSFFALITQACLEDLAPAALLSLLKHSLYVSGEKHYIQTLEKLALRGPKPAAGFAGLYSHLEQNKNTDGIEGTLGFLKNLETIIQPLLALREGEHDFSKIIKTHIKVNEDLGGGAEKIWKNEDGGELSTRLSDLIAHAQNMPQMSLKTYAEAITQIIGNVTIRPKYGTHPRLMILGQLEARLIDADLVIMGGLNEGSWPPDSGHDPWLSRPMRKDFGLPVYERSVGLSAHDFVQGFCAPRAVITRAKRSAGAPTIPARWLQRLNTVIDATKLPRQKIMNAPQKQWAHTLDAYKDFTPCTRPEPRPPITARPRQISVTQIETWLKDPYSVYARYVLKLKPLDPLEQKTDAAMRGTALHDILNDFITAHPQDMPDNAEDILIGLAQDTLNKNNDAPEIWNFWWPRFERLSQWFINHERARRPAERPLKTEISGAMTIDGLTINARADRIDLGMQGIIIIDYKSGGTYSHKSMRTGDTPQLPVEALMIQEQGFPEISTRNVEGLEYWTLTGKETEAGKITAARKDLDVLIEDTRTGLKDMIEAFNNPQTPYYSLPRDGIAPRFNDYEHLARIKEWAIVEESETSGKAA